MIRLSNSLLALLVTGLLSLQATDKPDRIVSVELAVETLSGKSAKPFRLGEKQAALLLFITHDCPISNGYAREYSRLHKEYSGKQIATWIIYVDPDAQTEELKLHQKEFGLAAFKAVHDEKHLLVAATGATMTPEAVVVGKTGGIEYRGRVDNLYADYGKRRRQATVRDLRDALDSVLAGKKVKRPRTEAIGCFIPTN